MTEPPCSTAKAGEPDGRRRVVSLKLLVLARQLRLNFDQGAKQAGLTRAKWTVIAAVALNPGATQRTIAAALEVSEVTAGRLIDRLCECNYLERRENPADRRGYRVYLTEATQPVLAVLGDVAKVHEERAFKGIGESDLALLDSLLDRISVNVAALRKIECASKAQAAADRSD